MEKEIFIFLMLLICLNIVLPYALKLFGYKIRMDVLSCGLVGHCGAAPADASMIKLLLLYNEERGEDSTGYFVNGTLVKNTEKVTKFLVENDIIISEEDNDYSVIGHARKCSSGVRYAKDLAHPFGIHNEGTDKNSPFDLVLAMNGTLSNTKEIAEKWDIDYKPSLDSDTKILAKIIAKLGMEDQDFNNAPFRDVLQAIDGTATLIFTFPKLKNTLFVYKDPDRPLFFYNQFEDQMYISSLAESLNVIGARKNEIMEFGQNGLFIIENGEISGSDIIVRNPIKPTASFRRINNPLTCAYNGRGAHYYASQSEYERSVNWNNGDNTTKSINIRERINNGEIHGKNKGGKIYTINERYFRNGHPCQGKIHVSQTGKHKTPSDRIKQQDVVVCWFVNGYMCNSEEAYDKVISRCTVVTDKGSGTYDVNKFKTIKLSEFVRYFKYPVLTIADGKEVWLLNEDAEKKTTKKGDSLEFSPFLSEETFRVIRTNRWTIGSKVVLGDVTEVKKNASEIPFEVSTDLQSEEGQEKTEAFLSKLLQDNPNDNDPNYVFCEVRRRLWKEDPSTTMRKYFFSFLVDIMVKYEIVSNITCAELKKLSEDSYCSGKEFNKQFSQLIGLLRKKMAEITLVKNIDTKSFSTKETIEIWKKNPEIFTEEEMVSDIRKTNVFYKMEDFQNDISCVTYPALSDLKNAWVASLQQEELFSFYEAVLLTMNASGRIEDEELLYALNTEGKDLEDKCNELYEDWRKFCVTEIINEEVKDTSVQNLENVDLDSNVEEITPDRIEEEYISEVKETIVGMEMLANRMLDQAGDNPKIAHLCESLKSNAEYMNRHILND